MKLIRSNVSTWRLISLQNILCISTGVVLCVYCGPLLSTDKDSTTYDPIADISDSIRAATSPSELRAAYSDCFEKLEREELLRLRNSKSEGIALQTEWYLVRKEVLQGQNNPVKGQLEIKQLLLHQYLGFIEGKIGITLPKWWFAGLSKAELYSTRAIMPFESIDIRWASMPYDIVYDLFYIPKGMKFESKDGIYRLSNQAEGIAIPAECLKEFSWVNEEGKEMFDCYLTVLAVDEQRYLFAACETAGTPCSLYYLEKDNQDNDLTRIVWKSRVWVEATVTPGKSGTGYFHWIDLQQSEGIVTVVGLCYESAYIESFSLSDGKNRFRFSTSY